MPKGPRQMLAVRDAHVINIFDQVGQGLNQMHKAFRDVVTDAHSHRPSDVTMYFGTTEYNRLFDSAYETFGAEDTQNLLRDIVAMLGARGAVVIGFDSFEHLPTFVLPSKTVTKAEDYWSDFSKADFNHPVKADSLWLSWYDTGEGEVRCCVAVAFNEPTDFAELKAGSHLMTTTHNSPIGRAAAVALWLMLTPTLTEMTEQTAFHGLPPKVKKGLEKKKANRESMVRVVNLRKRVRQDMNEVHEARKVEWQSSWIVKGHWRKQPYGPGRSLRRMTYITPFLKGPVDKPLKQKELVYRY